MEMLETHFILEKIKKRYTFFIGLLFLSLLLAILFGLFYGPVPIDIWRILSSDLSDKFQEGLIFNIRAPRVALAILAGGVLSVSGAILQVLFNNPLAEPGLVGISSGAVLGAMVGTILLVEIPFLGSSINYQSLLPVTAFIGALVMGTMVYKISQVKGKVNTNMLILAGIAVNSFAGAFAGLLIYLADDEQLRTITFWSLGSLNGSTWLIVWSSAIVVFLGGFFIFKISHDLEIFSLGEQEACNLGVEGHSLKRKVLVVVSLLVGTIISFTGLIGFVGLVVPHIIRMIVGNRLKPLLICSFLFGGVFLIICDLLAKKVVTPSELPIGVVTSLIGAPYFTYLLIKRKKEIE